MKKKIYILHGWTYDTEKWIPFVDLLKRNDIEPVLLKIPGLTAELSEVWDLDKYVEWLKNILKNEKEKVILLGHSNGGRINIAFAYKYPEKVEKLILVDSAGIYHNELPIRIKRFVFKSIAKIGRKMHSSERLRFWLYRLARENDYRKANPMTRKTMQNLISADLTSLLPQLSVPTTIIWGENDRITPVNDGELMQKKIKNSRFHLIKDARHSPQFSHVNEVVDIIIASIK